MDKKQIRDLLDFAHEEALAFVEANPKINFRTSEELFDNKFFDSLSRCVGTMTISEIAALIRDAD